MRRSAHFTVAGDGDRQACQRRDHCDRPDIGGERSIEPHQNRRIEEQGKGLCGLEPHRQAEAITQPEDADRRSRARENAYDRIEIRSSGMKG